MKHSFQFLWDEEKTRRLFKAFLIMMMIGSSAALIFTATYPKFNPYNLVLSGLIIALITICMINLLIINRFDARVKFLIFLLMTQTIAAVFMGFAGGFLGIFQFGAYLLLIFSLFELGTDATVTLGVYAIASFTLTLAITAVVNPHNELLTEFLYYTIAYTVVLVIERNIGKELSLQIEARRKLEQVDDIKNQFIALSSHYLRTPLTIIKAFARDLKDEDINVQHKNRLALFRSSVEQLDLLIEKFLLISSIQRGDLKLSLASISLKDLVSSLCQEFQSVADNGKIHFDCQLPEGEVMIQADYLKLKEALASILDNAFKYNHPGGEVTVSLDTEAANAIIKVTDTGSGINPQQLEVLFDPLNKGGIEHVLAQDKPGVGLSLYLTKLIITAHHARLEVQSTLSKGSVFKIILTI